MSSDQRLPILLVFTEHSSRDRIREEAAKRGLTPRFVASEGDPDADVLVFDVLTDAAVARQRLRLQLGEDPVGILNCHEQTSVAASEVATLIGVAPSTTASARILRDKRLMKEAWTSAGVPTPLSTQVTSIKDLAGRSHRFPVIVKPVSGAASAGVRIVDNEDELSRAVKKVLRFNRGTLEKEGLQASGALIEDYVDGPEYAVDLIWHDTRPVRAAICSKGSPEGPTFPDRLYYMDPKLDAATARLLLDTAALAGRAAGVCSGATHTEMRVSADGTAWVIESALRPGASGGLYITYEEASGEDFFGPLVDTALPPRHRLTGASEPLWRAPVRAAYWYNVSYQQTGRVLEMALPDGFAAEHPCVSEVVWRRKLGDYLPPEGASYGYLAWFRGCTTLDPEELRVQLEAAEAALILRCE